MTLFAAWVLGTSLLFLPLLGLLSPSESTGLYVMKTFKCLPSSDLFIGTLIWGAVSGSAFFAGLFSWIALAAGGEAATDVNFGPWLDLLRRVLLPLGLVGTLVTSGILTRLAHG